MPCGAAVLAPGPRGCGVSFLWTCSPGHEAGPPCSGCPCRGRGDQIPPTQTTGHLGPQAALQTARSIRAHWSPSPAAQGCVPLAVEPPQGQRPHGRAGQPLWCSSTCTNGKGIGPLLQVLFSRGSQNKVGWKGPPGIQPLPLHRTTQIQTLCLTLVSKHSMSSCSLGLSSQPIHTMPRIALKGSTNGTTAETSPL